ncbi:hypothetical protein QWT69_16710 [Sporosarcina oncorhynchi]|uniref:Uncharacterized protein n=1 Tax=Sporosarcina oncorhynchi TaxID=3056444 RepID=A0ABZ0L5U8_9BACL|nr:hypothetical protein [Sporosarcina sp. T2O-4]WOV87468.1 hypothetical protein QWT69_16710 [Sporosarcina sp. T2O-4]
MTYEFKYLLKKLIQSYKKYGPQWKPGRDIIHLKKRISRNDLPFETTLQDYSHLITTIVVNEQSNIHIYNMKHFQQGYIVFSFNSWVVIVGEDYIMETAMITRSPDNYLSTEKGYTYIGTVKEVLSWIE